MNTLKKIICLLLILVFVFGTAKAQSAAANSKITITNFKVYEKNNQLIIDWKTNGVVDANYWQVQRSEDGKEYATIALVFGPDPRQGTNTYQYKGKLSKAGGKISYRVSPVDNREKEINTEIIPATK